MQDRDVMAHRSESFKHYSQLLTAYAAFAQEAGYDVKAFNPNAASRFPALPAAQQQAVIRSLETQVSIFSSAVADGIKLRQNGLSLAWLAIRSLNLRPLSDVFSHLKADDIIEIYDEDHVQIFRTFDFLKCVSYSLDEVHTHSWWELYERDQTVTEKMIGVATSVISEKKPVTILAPFAHHQTRETFSPRLRTAQIESRLVSTLVDSQGTPRAYINAFALLSVVDGEPRIDQDADQNADSSNLVHAVF